MFNQTGITIFELLIGLSIMSGVSLYTMKMTEEVENAVVVYQERVQDVKALKAKLKLVKQTHKLEEYESMIAAMKDEMIELDDVVELDE